MSPNQPSWSTEAWYVACTPDEIDGKPLGRTICAERMVFFRGNDGQAAAVEDFCPHRGAPLSLGFVRDGTLVCGYHGLEVGCDGRARSMPGQMVRNFPPIRAFAVIERYGFIWVWPGDRATADPTALRHQPWAEDPACAYGGGMFHIACDYRLMIDNLMDLTHETYVHASSIGQKEIDEASVATTTTEDEVITKRAMHGIQAPPFYRMVMRGLGLDEDMAVDRWQICRFSLPSSVMIDVGVAPAGHGGIDADPATKIASTVVDFITPETDGSHWYFWGMARYYAVDDPAMTDSIRAGQHKIFSEDLEMLQRQQDNLARYPERRLLKLNIDAGGVRSRMMIDRAISAERRRAASSVETAA
ncbi:aromatic ring-hydroxylating dioxygenase subunit alpha [Sphingomonas sp.]|uniref:aromatic ring-hydroxylating dioxygenase subunit alpha n=1 Tax=Sphingomonas sp. TaxID=28214 RepID=UPI002D8026B6|nr:aromatic ring-hydroxylating dioxygenase subunit alpha [Sphingomonas sp.]HEU0043519.1 aromatic ring-hydroxylating dioxygenase subunit alpha [Sphingomonas sp.]